MNPLKIADEIKPHIEMDMENMKCCLSTCCITKHINNWKNYIKKKSSTFFRFKTV